MSKVTEKMLVRRLEKAQIAAQKADAFLGLQLARRTDLFASCNAIESLSEAFHLAEAAHELALRLDGERRKERDGKAAAR